jgi:hypothetical protein
VCADPLPDGIGCIDDGQCASKHCGLRPGSLARHCFTPGTATLGQDCLDEQHCGEGQCWGSPFWPAHCLCVENAQCAASATVPDGYVCKTGNWGLDGDAGFCIPPRQAGEACNDARECAAGLQCGGGQCYAPHTRHNWESCVAGDHCISGGCFNGQCRCSQHDECQRDPAFGAGGYCDQGPWLLGNDEGKCYAPRVHDGAYCEDGDWCASGHCQNNRCYTPASKHNWEACSSNEECAGGLCWNGQCRCYEHGQCQGDTAFGPDSYCNLGDWFPWNEEGRCHGKLADGAACEDPEWCAGGGCNNFVCYTRFGRGVGEACAVADQCATGVCNGTGRCGCTSTAQCGAGTFCNGDRQCVPKLASNIGLACDAPEQCESGLCGRSEIASHDVCYDHAGFPPGHACQLDAQCASNDCFVVVDFGFCQ